MIIRIALFITLLAFFYHYCSEDTSKNQLREPNDINRIDVPYDLFPEYMNYSHTVKNIRYDSSTFQITSLQTGYDSKGELSAYP